MQGFIPSAMGRNGAMMNELDFSTFPTLKTNRLFLRKLELHDDELIFEYRSNKENFPFVDMPVYTTIAEAQSFIKKMNTGLENNKWLVWAIADLKTDKILGTISIWNISLEESKAELGFGLFPGNLGKGFMSEALRKIVEYGFVTMGLRVIEAYTNKVNMKSRTLLERNNFFKVASIIDPETSSGLPTEMVIYQRKFEY